MSGMKWFKADYTINWFLYADNNGVNIPAKWLLLDFQQKPNNLLAVTDEFF